MTSRSNYHDFGNVITGAKKFNYIKSDEDIKDLETLSLLKQATKKVLWPEPELGQKDRFVEFLIYQLRSCIRAKLNTKNREEIISFVNQVISIRDLAESCTTEKEILDVIEHIQKGRNADGKLLYDQELVFYKRLNSLNLTRTEMERSFFGIPKDEVPYEKAKQYIHYFIFDKSCSLDLKYGFFTRTSPKGMVIYRAGENVDLSALKEDGLVITDKAKILKVNAAYEDIQVLTNELAEKIKEDEKKITNKRKMSPRISYEHLKEVIHEGSDYRGGQNIGTAVLHKTFGFNGGQFGNWLSQKERAQVVNMAYDAFADLAVALDIEPENVSLDGGLSIAFGARGYGKSRAHYELERRVINLTRIKGAGTLAHEWCHSLDHYLSIINYSSTELASTRSNLYETLDKIREMLSNYESTYRFNSLTLDTYEHRKQPYWASIPEMMARAFNCYIVDKLKDMGIRNDYLAFEFKIGVEIEGNYIDSNPQGEEREKLNALFDELISELVREGVFSPLENKEELIVYRTSKPVFERQKLFSSKKSLQLSFI